MKQFIPDTGGTAYLSPCGHAVTFAMTIPGGSVVIEQAGIDDDSWFEFKSDGVSANMDSDNTAKSVYAPIKLKVTATGTGVRLYNNSKPNYSPNIIES